MKRTFLMSAVFLLLLSSFILNGDVSAAGGNSGSEQVFTGYISDIRSAEMNSGVMMDGTDLKLHPERNTVSNMKTLPNAMSGYGLFLKNDSGSAYMFYRFDRNGIMLSRELLDKTVKKSGVTVRVTGFIRENILYVTGISEI